MPHILSNSNVEIHIDFPEKGYIFSRFDWTGKLVTVKYKGTSVSGTEGKGANSSSEGKGFYNEFGIDQALGFDETELGGWFHKIGIGLLKKENKHYNFSKSYLIKPAKFRIETLQGGLNITCYSELMNGYAYILRKEIRLSENGFTIYYCLENTGNKEITTNEYNHNFIAINGEAIDSSYQLSFPFLSKAGVLGASINPNECVDFEEKSVQFKALTDSPFYFSNLSADTLVDAKWELRNNEIKVSEQGSFQTKQVNLWGNKSVISPELFIALHIKPNQIKEWSRTYCFKKLKV